MSTETKPLKLMPHTKRISSSGLLSIEPGDRAGFDLPADFRSLFEALDQGASLSTLVDQVDVSKAGSRFRFIKKFLIFLDEHDMLADRDYIRLADSLNIEYTWPTSVMTTDLAAFSVAPLRRRPPSRTVSVILMILTVALAIGSLVYATYVSSSGLEQPPSTIRSLALFLLSFSLARSFQATWVWVVSRWGGSAPQLDLVIEPISIRLRQEQNGRSVPGVVLLSNALSFISMFGVAAIVSRFAQSQYEFDVAMIAGAFAFFTETSPYSRSSVTDLLRSLYSSLEERSVESGAREQAIRRAHVTVCVAWVLFLGVFLVLDASSVLLQTWQLTRVLHGLSQLAGFGILILLLLFAVNWIADLFGAASYDEASSGHIRRLWRRKNESTLERVKGLPPSAFDLEKLPFLRQIPHEIRKPLLQAAQVRAFSDGESVCRQGDKDRNLFVVLEGRLAVARTQSGAGGHSRRKVVAWLDPGAVFGENAFFFGQARSADVVGMDSGRVLVLPHTKEINLIEGERSNELRVRIWFLQALVQSEFFRELPSESLDSILHAGVEQRFAAGTKVIQEGEAADACYFMVQGRASVTQKTQVIGKINAGDAFGEISILFPGTLRTATIVADTDLMTIRIDRDKFWKLLKAHLPLALEIERLGLKRLKKDRAKVRT
jgi:CRP-like cAMP-binding protein/NADH:ubiquinone oxidoreductase subunit 3 (subunit A)